MMVTVHEEQFLIFETPPTYEEIPIGVVEAPLAHGGIARVVVYGDSIPHRRATRSTHRVETASEVRPLNTGQWEGLPSQLIRSGFEPVEAGRQTIPSLTSREWPMMDRGEDSVQPTEGAEG